MSGLVNLQSLLVIYAHSPLALNASFCMPYDISHHGSDLQHNGMMLVSPFFYQCQPLEAEHLAYVGPAYGHVPATSLIKQQNIPYEERFYQYRL